MKYQGKSKLKIGIVIINYNRLDLTTNCLTSLKSVNYSNYEIIVVDNASNDDSAFIIPVDFPKVHFFPQRVNKGFSGGNNIGITWCLQQNFDAILLLNNDTVVEPDFLDWMVQSLDYSKMVIPRILSLKNPNIFGACIGDFDWLRGVWKNTFYGKYASIVPTIPCEVYMASACCLLIPKNIFEKIGFFDDNYFLYFEDADFIIRAKNAGFNLIYEPRATIFHNERSSTDEKTVSPMVMYYNIRNRLYFMQKNHRNRLEYSFFLSYFFITCLLRSFYFLMNGKWSRLLALFRGIYDFFAHNMHQSKKVW